MDGKFIAFSLTLLLTTITSATKILIVNEGKKPILENILDEGKLNPEDRAILRFVVDFAVRSKWEELLVIVPASSGVLQLCSTDIYQYFASRGIFISVHSTLNKLLPRSFVHVKHRLGIVVVWGPEMNAFFDEASIGDAFDEYRFWLFVNGEEENGGENMTGKLEELNFGLESEAVISRIERILIPTKAPKSTEATTEISDLRYYEVGEKICVPENENENWYRGICITGSALPLRIKRDTGRYPSANDPQTVLSVNQIYKIPGWENDLVQINLGYWDFANGLNNVREMVPVEKRLNFRPFRIVVGIKNVTLEGGASPPNNFLTEREEYEEMHMNEIFDCLFHGLNASREIQTFPKLGWRNEEGGWTHMLGAVAEGNLDIALDTLNVKMDPFQDFLFTNPIVKTMNNIYFRRPGSGGMRDIFLAPFSSDLVASVFGINFLLALAMITILIFNYNLSWKNQISKKEVEEEVKVDADERKWEASDAFLWSVSVMCMQGSSWHPISTSGSLLLISGLLFALVIYNSYAAFITSVLSVKTVRIKTLQDLLLSDFAFGYTLGKSDELYLRTVNDSLLRELYFKGLRENDGVNDPVTGMLKAGMGNYAFFAAAPFARKTLRREVPHAQRCGIQELILPRTKTVAAIPMSRNSPLRKVINYRLLRMMESGILRRFQSAILLPMPRCVERTKFNSARFADVYSAFYIISLGWMVSLLFLLGEIFYHKRKAGGKSRPGQKHSIHFTLPHLPHFDFHWPRHMHN